MMLEITTFWQGSPLGDKCERIAEQEHVITPGEDAAISSDTDSGTEDNEYSEIFADLVRQACTRNVRPSAQRHLRHSSIAP
ncbi:unnamed protein product [Sphagnum jensenii]|uniref:Uncharacterized protein n=1 Tax=Sphagnum jensenii TaxID=128206 RepID=A0ABP1C1T8_9BRYO